MTSDALETSYFTRTGVHTFQPTHWTSGAWRETEQHFSPIGGLIVHAVDDFLAARGTDDGMVMARLSFDILGVVVLEEMDIQVETLRSGRSIELIEATVSAGGRAVVRGRIWRLAVTDTSAIEGGAEPPLTPPDQFERWKMNELWPGDYIQSLDVRAVREPVPGRGTAWLRSDIALVADEPISPLAHFVRLTDTANGIAVRESPVDWLYPNLDLGIHLHRQPRGDWTGLDTTVVFGPTGQGLTSTVLHDIDGPIGRAEQTLTVRAMSQR